MYDHCQTKEDLEFELSRLYDALESASWRQAQHIEFDIDYLRELLSEL